MNPVNDRINNIAAKIAGLSLDKLSALNGSGGGGASSAGNGGVPPSAIQSQRGFSTTIIQTNNDLEEQKKKLAELVEEREKEADKLEDLIKKHSEAVEAYDKLAGGIDDLTKKSERWKEIQKTLRDAYNGNVKLTRQQIEALIDEGRAIEDYFKQVRAAVDSEVDLANQAEEAAAKIQELGEATTTTQGKIAGLEKTIKKAKIASAISKIFSVLSWAAIIVTIIQAVAALVKWIGGIETAAKKQRELNRAIDEGAASISAKSIVAFKELTKRYRELGDSAEKKKQFLVEFRKEIEETGLAINNVNDADNAFINNTGAYIQALKDRAKAQAIENEAVRVYQEFLEKKAKKENTRRGERKRKERELAQDLVGAGVMTQEEADQVGKFKKLEKAEQKVEKTLDRLFEEMFELEKRSKPFFANAAAESVSAAADAKAEELKQLKQYYDEALKLFMDASTRELQEVEDKYAEQIALAKKHNQDTTLLERAKQREINEIIKKYEDERIQRQKEQVEKELERLQKEIDRIRMMNDTSNLREPQEQSFTTEYKQGFGHLFAAGSKFFYQSGEDVQNQYNAQVEYNNKLLELTKSRIEQENEILNKQLEVEGITAERKLEIERTLRENEMALSDAAIKNEADNIAAYRSLQEKKNSALQNSLSVASEVFGAMATIAGEETKAGKAFAVTQAIINTFASANAAYASMAGIPYVGPALGIAAAAAAVASGIANVKTILSTKVSSDVNSVSISSGAAATPPALSTPPIEYTRNLLGDKETDEINKPMKVYVLESDITEVQNKVKVTENNASF